MNRQKIIEEILSERKLQIKKHGPKKYTPIEWISILVEEVGEVSKEIGNNYIFDWNNKKQYRAELIQVAAVALAMIESYDGNIEE